MPHPVPCEEGPDDPEESETAKANRRASYLVNPDASGDASYYQSTAYIMEQLNARRVEKTPESESNTQGKKAANQSTTAMVTSGVLSDEDAWLLASMEYAIRNPFCIANHKAKEQVAFYEKVFCISFIFMCIVALGTMLYTFLWGQLLQSGAKPFMPCRSPLDGNIFGSVRLCNDTSSRVDDGCDDEAPLSICLEDACINDPESDDIRDCWYVAAGVMAVLVVYLVILFRRDQAGVWLLFCACCIECIWGGAATLSFETSFFLELFTYLACTFILTLIIFRHRTRQAMIWWTCLPAQVGSTTAQQPDVEVVVYKEMRKCLGQSAVVVSLIALMWHFALPTRLLGGTHLAFFLAVLFLWLSVGWILREISWTSHKFDPEAFVPMCISFHVDVYAVVLVCVVFFMHALTDICSPKEFCYQMDACCGRCSSFARGLPLKDVSKDDVPVVSAPTCEVVMKEVEAPEALRRRKVLNAASGIGIVALAAVIFISPVLSFVVSLLICVVLPFIRAKAKGIQETDHSTM